MSTVFRARVDGVLTAITLGGGFALNSGSLSVSGGSSAWGGVTGTLADQTDLQAALDAKSATSHNHDSAYAAAAHNHTITALSGFPGGTATFLRADGSFAAPAGGSDPWTYRVLAADFTTSNSAAQNVTWLDFTPVANTKYEVEGRFYVRTATATVGARPGCAWPTGLTDGIASLWVTSSATAQVLANGNINAAVLCPVGGLPNTTQSYPAWMEAALMAGASPSGTFKIQLASETNGTNVTMKAGSYIKYRSYT